LSRATTHTTRARTESGSNAKSSGDKRDAVNADILQRVKGTFQGADRDGSGRLATHEFVKAFLGILQTEDGGDAEALSKLFMRIDANSDGSIDWDEFSSYMLLESQGSASIRELESSITFEAPVTPFVPEGGAHRDVITAISHVQLSNGADRYVTCGKDGVVKVWNCKDMKLLKSLAVGKSWVTCARLLPLTRKLAVSSFSRAMKIYDLHTYELCGQIAEIDYAPMAMDVWVPHRNKDVEMVVFGDGGGFVRLYELRINPLEDKNSNDRFIDTPKWAYQHHSDWVTSVKYVEDTNCVIAGSLDKFVSITDAEERVPLKVLEGHIKGVTTVDWSSMYKFVCSGGQDRRIYLWNPFSQKPLAQLTGHTGSLQQVIVNDRDNQIISLGSDKTIKVWDIRNHKCLQTVQDRELYPLDDTLHAMEFDMKRKQLLTGNLKPKMWQQIITTSASAGHRDPITRVLYNPMFSEAVSGDHGGTVSVWHVPSGKLRFRFYNAHEDQRITAMNFDTARRRLLTGSESGEVKVWNFSSGACLSRLKPRNREEVTAVLAIRGSLMRHFLVAGWDRRITFYEDNAERSVGPGRSISGHRADILDMVIMENSPTVVTASDDGEVWAWNIDSGAPKRKMIPPGHADRSPDERPIEAVRFLHGKMRNILVSVGADRFMRFWEVHEGVCVLEVFTGHKLGETVLALAIDPKNEVVVTGDSGGFIKVWDMSGFRSSSHAGMPPSCSEAAAATALASAGGGVPMVREVAVWRAHHKVITSVDLAPVTHGLFVLSSSHDKALKLWTQDGVLVGIFGNHVWKLDDPATWQARSREPLDHKDKFDLDVGRRDPRVVGTLGRPNTSHLAHQYSFVSTLAAASGTASPMTPMLAAGADQAGGSGRPSSAPLEVARVMESSYRQRLSRVGTLKKEQREMRRSSMLGTPESPLSPKHPPLMERSSTLGPVASFRPSSAVGSAGGDEGIYDDEEDEEEGDVVESDTSSAHDSDVDVPKPLWVEDFDAARKGRPQLDVVSAVQQRHLQVYQPKGSKGLNFPSTMGRRDGAVAHLLHISEPAKLPERPSTSYKRG